MPTLLRSPALWAHLHALTVIADAGSFTAAAQRLGVSKASISQRVTELEAAAGLPLVRRTTRSVRLTEAGQQLVDSIREAFGAIDQAFAGVRDLAGAPRGLLRVTAPVALGRQQIVPLLPEFLLQHPELQLELELSDRLSALNQEGFDLALRHTSQPPDTHVAWALCETRSVLVATSHYLAARGVPGHPKDLAAHACLHYPRPGDTPVWSFEPPEGGSRVSVAVRGPLATNNSEALRAAALGDLGIALVPDFSAQDSLATGALQQVLPAWQAVGAFGTHLWAIRPHTAQVPLAVRVLVTWLRERLAAGFAVDQAAAQPKPAAHGRLST